MWDVQAANPRPQFDSIVHLPGAAPGAPRVDAPCRVLSLRGNRLALLTDREIPPCIPLTVEHDDALYLGEVVGSGQLLQSDPLLQSQAAPEPTGNDADRVGYRVDVLIEQVLSGLQSLVTLRARLLDEAARSDERASGEPPITEGCTPGVPVHVRNRRA